ncbi:type IV pilus modification PilV family protein [Deinococcota bacterium DY0809b]
MKRGRGFSLVELLVALSILVVVTAVLATALVNSMRNTRNAGQRSEAVQLLNYAGRRLVSGDLAVLPSPSVTTRKWGYGELAGAFPELSSQGRFTNPNLYSLEIKTGGTVGVGGSTLTMYTLKVCWQSEKEYCVTAETIGPDPSAASASGPLPGLN